MAFRKVVFADGEIYHIYNRAVAAESIFEKDRESEHFLSLINYYRYHTPLRYTHYRNLSNELRIKYWLDIQKTVPQVEIYAFSLMPNHFHLLVKQMQVDGIQKFTSILQNSYAKYYNTKNNRYGSVFQNPFKATRIETDDQFIHVVRYIHLNPVTAYLIKPEELSQYKLTSYCHYLNNITIPFISDQFVMSHFNNSIDKLISFTMNNVDYQRELAKIKHLILD